MNVAGRTATFGLALLMCAGDRRAAPGDLPVAWQSDPQSVLVAGDGSLPVFDNAVASMTAVLRKLGGGAPANLQRLSASPSAIAQFGVRSATWRHVTRAIATMKPAAGQGCFVFATSHGVADAGLYLSLRDEVLTPRELDRALLQGCGNAPTVVIISACFSGSFVAPPMNRPNRIILTAARADRTSFGCHAGREYTVFDQCLLQALGRDTTWRQVYLSTRNCVRTEEQHEDVTASEPQAWFGSAH